MLPYTLRKGLSNFRRVTFAAVVSVYPRGCGGTILSQQLPAELVSFNATQSGDGPSA